MRNRQYESKITIIIHLFTSACLIFNAVCDIYFLSKKEFSWSIKIGKNIKSSSLNTGYYINISALLWMITAVFFAFAEICMICKVSFFYNSFFGGFLRPFIYLAMGIINFGICNDLGIIAGVFIMVMAIVWLILNAFSISAHDF